MDSALSTEFEKYPFDEDKVFQEGLKSIIESSTNFAEMSDEEKKGVVDQAKAFYFAKITGKDFDSPEQSTPAPLHESQTAPGLTRELSLQEITQLIESGQTHLIPNNFEIPSGVNESAPSQPAAAVKKKPWENAVLEESVEEGV